MKHDLASLLTIYTGSDGEKTKALYTELETLGPAGTIAVNLFRACKASERAKGYRRRFKGAAYNKKQWSMENLAAALLEHADALGIVWGWGEDPMQPYHRWVLYVELPTGQVSYHAAYRGEGPDYEKKWDGVTKMGPTRICQWIVQLMGQEAKAA